MIAESPIAEPLVSDTAASGWLLHNRNILTALLLIALAWSLYLPSIRYGFVYYDDVRILKDHPELYGQPTLAADLKAIFVTCFPREEPLLIRDVSWALDSRLFGFDNPFGYHLGNVFLHGVVVALLFVFLLATTGRYDFALATTAAWLLLAVHTEPIAWIMGRKDILSALFMLLALLAQIRRLESKSAWARGGFYVLTLVLFAAGLFSKISVLTFPLVLLLHAIFFPYLRAKRSSGEPFTGVSPLLKEALLALPALAISGLVYVWYQRTLLQMGIFDRGYNAHGAQHLWNLLMVDPMALLLYLRHIFLPAHLAVVYNWPGVQGSYSVLQVAASLAIVAGICVFGLWLLRRRKDLFFYYAAFFVLMIPYTNLLYVGIWVADRYVYLGSFCVLALAVSLALPLLRGLSRLRIVVLVVSGSLLGWNAFQKLSYAKEWRNGETLWQYHLSLPSLAPGAFENLAAYYYAQAAEHPDPEKMAMDIKKMEVVVDAGLKEFWPDRTQPPPQYVSYLLFLRSLVEEVTGQPEAALQCLLLSDRLRPDFEATNLNLARLYSKLSRNASDPQQRLTCARAAAERFGQYVRLAFRGRALPPAVQSEFEKIKGEADTLANSSR